MFVTTKHNVTLKLIVIQVMVHLAPANPLVLEVREAAEAAQTLPATNNAPTRTMAVAVERAKPALIIVCLVDTNVFNDRCLARDTGELNFPGIFLYTRKVIDLVAI
jgi:hypothetical protein